MKLDRLKGEIGYHEAASSGNVWKQAFALSV
jgi:hypothetical protein